MQDDDPGGTRQAHTAECRERFRQLMQDEGKVQKTNEKRKEYEDRMAEKEADREDKRKKKEERRAKRSAGADFGGGEDQRGGS